MQPVPARGKRAQNKNRGLAQLLAAEDPEKNPADTVAREHGVSGPLRSSRVWCSAKRWEKNNNVTRWTLGFLVTRLLPIIRGQDPPWIKACLHYSLWKDRDCRSLRLLSVYSYSGLLSSCFHCQPGLTAARATLQQNQRIPATSWSRQPKFTWDTGMFAGTRYHSAITSCLVSALWLTFSIGLKATPELSVVDFTSDIS